MVIPLPQGQGIGPSTSSPFSHAQGPRRRTGPRDGCSWCGDGRILGRFPNDSRFGAREPGRREATISRFEAVAPAVLHTTSSRGHNPRWWTGGRPERSWLWPAGFKGSSSLPKGLHQSTHQSHVLRPTADIFVAETATKNAKATFPCAQPADGATGRRKTGDRNRRGLSPRTLIVRFGIGCFVLSRRQRPPVALWSRKQQFSVVRFRL